MTTGDMVDENSGLEIAIIGLSGRFPGAADIETFWEHLRSGVESVTFFDDQQLLDAGIDPALISNPQYVKAQATLADVDRFDAAFFGIPPREADLLDPQQRLLLECAWEALERSGYDPEQYRRRIGVYAGASMNSYLLHHLLGRSDLLRDAGARQLVISNDKDFLATRISYKLNLTGPSVTVQTACSTSLTAVHLACQSLLSGECDLALAGGVTVRLPQVAGYLYVEGGIDSPDGHCRAFDAQGRGIVGGSGAGLVVLKRLAEALEDGDTIHAVIKGWAMNNDGGQRAGYTAPTVAGQAAVIRAAHAMSQIEPAHISYVEAHGTATPLGDLIEISALKEVFGSPASRPRRCAIGSVKTNIGHLDAAAGVAGLIKTVLALTHQELPPSLHYVTPNPQLDLMNSPFEINNRLRPWPSGGMKRRAGVSSFGIGGTNVHVVLEEAPALPESGLGRPFQLLILSAKTASALEHASRRLATYLRANPQANLADVAYTLQVGRRTFGHRRVLVCRDPAGAAAQLEQTAPPGTTAVQETSTRPVVFLFPGQGAQYHGMASGLYAREPLFRVEIDRCAELLLPHLGGDIRPIIFGQNQEPGIRSQPLVAETQALNPTLQALDLNDTAYAQPALFVVEYALARLWMAWGIQPQAMLGHSIGEYVAACLAGVFSLEDALALVAARGLLCQALPVGAMLSIAQSAEQVRGWLPPELDLAAINGPQRCVVAGPLPAVALLEQRLAAQQIETRRLHTSHAFHSAMLDPILADFAARLQRVVFQPPQLPYLSNLTGGWVTPEQVCHPDYWVEHLRRTVRFADCLAAAATVGPAVLLEVGPGQSLTSLARQHPATASLPAVASLRPPHEQQDDQAWLLGGIGRLWLLGFPIAWERLYEHEHRRRIQLPTYPFERQRHWIEPHPVAQEQRLGRRELADWFYVPAWRPHPLPPERSDQMLQGSTVILTDRWLGERLGERLRAAGQRVLIVRAGAGFAQHDAQTFTIAPEQRANYDQLLQTLAAQGDSPARIVHLWTLDSAVATDLTPANFAESQTGGFTSLLYLAQALGDAQSGPLALTVVANGLQNVSGAEPVDPRQATLLGPCRVIPQENPQISCRCVDVVLVQPGGTQHERLLGQLADEISHPGRGDTVAYRGPQRLVQVFEPLHLEQRPHSALPLRERGTYLITGGLGGVGLEIAEWLAKAVRARLVLTGRSDMPTGFRWRETPATGVLAAFADLRPAEALAQAQSVFGQQPGPRTLDQYDGLEPSAKRLCAAYIVAALRQLGVETSGGRSYQIDVLHKQIGAVPQFARFVEFFLRVLAEDGVIQRAGATITFCDAPDLADPQGLAADLAMRFPEFAPVLDLLGHCAASYPAVLRGQIDGIAALYPQGRPDALERAGQVLLEHGNEQQALRLLCELVRQAASLLPADQTLRILEIGGGNGRLTRALLPALAGIRASYHFTDISRSFLVKAQREFGAAHGAMLHYGLLDIGSDPGAQGFELGSFDLIIGLNVVHATVDLTVTLGNLKQLLVPQGMLMLIEPVMAQRWVDMIWGLTNGWWHFNDAYRSDSPLLSIPVWERLLEDLQIEAALYPIEAEQRAITDCALLVAQVPATQTSAPTLQPTSSLDARFQRLHSIEAHGAEVLLLQADVSDLTQMQAAVEQAQAVFGPIHGVIHAAVVEGGGTIQLKTNAAVDQEFAPKIAGTLVLDALFRDQPLDFLVLCSSINAITGGFGLVSYCAASAFLDAFAQVRSLRGVGRVLAINWDRWRGVGTAVTAAARHRAITGEEPLGGMNVAEALEVFQRILATRDLPQVLVSTQDFAARLQQMQRYTLADLQERSSDTLHMRPQLQQQFVGPRTPAEQRMAEIWQAVFGINQIGIHDNFSELGGDSLLATQLVARIRETFQVELPLRSLFETPTVAGLCGLIEVHQQPEDLDELERLLQEIEGLSEDEVQASLAELSNDEETNRQ